MNELIVNIIKENKEFKVYNTDTKELVVSEIIPYWMLRKAVKYDVLLKKGFYKDGKSFWRQVIKDDYIKALELGINVPTKRINRIKNPFNNKRG